jgi:hypothetical protein
MIPRAAHCLKPCARLRRRCRLLFLGDGEVNELAHDPHAECHVEGRSMPFPARGLLCERLVN